MRRARDQSTDTALCVLMTSTILQVDIKQITCLFLKHPHMDQMPIVTRLDCTQVDLTEDWEMVFDGSPFTGDLVKGETDFDACPGQNKRNNNLWAYVVQVVQQWTLDGVEIW